MHSDHITRPEPIKLCECGCGQPAPIAQRTNTAKGHVKGQPVRYLPGHHLRGRPNFFKGKSRRPISERFWSMVDKRGPDECWPWTGYTDPNGYGTIFYKGKTRKAHRVAYELHYGPIPEGEGYHGTCVLHDCDNPPCCNPAHLTAGTAADNSDDMVSKGRAARGSRSGMSKLNELDIPTIRRLYAEGQNFTDIGKLYGVSYVTIRNIVNRVTWKHVA